MRIFVILISCFYFFPHIHAQDQHAIDSLKSVISSAKHDSIITQAYIEWDNMIYSSDPDLDLEIIKIIEKIAKENLNKKSLNNKEIVRFKKDYAFALTSLGVISFSKSDFILAENYYQSALKIWLEMDNKSGIASSYGNIGNLYYQKGDLSLALSYYNKSFQISEEIDDKQSMGNALGNIGNVYADQGIYQKAINAYTKSLKIQENLKNDLNVAYFESSIGILYKDIGDYDSALKRYLKSLEIFEKIKDQEGLAMSYNNLGNLYADKKERDKAIEYLTKSMNLYEKIGDKKGVGIALCNIASMYDELGDYSTFLELNKQSLKIQQEIDDKKGMAMSLNNIGIALNKLGNTSDALVYMEKALQLSKELGLVIETRNASEALYSLYSKTGRYKKALDMHILYITMKDSIAGEDAAKNIISQGYKYEYEKQKAIDDAEHDKMMVIKQKEKEKQQIMTYAVSCVLVMVVIFLIFVFNRLRITRKQKRVIEEQKIVVESAHEQLEEKNKDILDSINYAKRIQTAILPPGKVVKEYLKESFILYKPKDIVAGDFYWMEQKNNKVLFAAADCTGHGVPGAMVSVVCNNGLNRSVREYGLTDPGKILDKTKDIVLQEFEKSEDDVKDGMDIALCSLAGDQLQYAGAHNPLWIIRNDEILETKADKQPIGKFWKTEPFTTHTIDLLKGDTIYIFSDGYVDQFGGEKSKKFKSKAFKELLISIQHLSMEEQRLFIDETFEKWRGDIDQIDDVCVIGVRV